MSENISISFRVCSSKTSDQPRGVAKACFTAAGLIACQRFISCQSWFLMCCVSWIEKPEGAIIKQERADLDSTARSSPLAFLKPCAFRNS